MINSRFLGIILKVEKNHVLRAIRNGLVDLIPILTIGAFALILKSFPLLAYQQFIQNFLGGFLFNIFNTIYTATYGLLSIYMVLSLSLNYFRLKTETQRINIWGPTTSLVCFLILVGFCTENFSKASLGAVSIFLSMISAFAASSMYEKFYKIMVNGKRLYSYGADSEFNNAIEALGPATFVILIFSIVNLIITKTFNENTVYSLLIDSLSRIFNNGDMGFGKGFIFVLTSSILWFFGIHGSDCLEGVASKFFVPLLDENIAAFSSGSMPTQILTKQFFDCFILLGGCGSTICLLLAIIIFSKDNGSRSIAKTAAFPMIFNINELMVFGLPIIYNPVMLIPFICVPLINYSVSYLAMYTGLVPVITANVEWTTPIILGGYFATHSVVGSLLQIFNLGIGTLVYAPFVRLLDKDKKQQRDKNYESFIEYFMKNESDIQNIRLSELDNINGNIAKVMLTDLKIAFENNELKLFYQPQFSYDGTCVGVEALLRWKYKNHGFVYPPLAIKLANEAGMLEQIEEHVLVMALDDTDRIYKHFGNGIKISVNVTGTTIANDNYLEFLKECDKKYKFASRNICIEITEQAALSFNHRMQQNFADAKAMGITFAIDDFTMGQTSITYLKDSLFDIIKLDGSLVRGLNNNVRCKDIVYSLVQLSKSLGIMILAEFVEQENQREILHQIGCDYYQGYLYSPAVSIDNED